MGHKVKCAKTGAKECDLRHSGCNEAEIGKDLFGGDWIAGKSGHHDCLGRKYRLCEVDEYIYPFGSGPGDVKRQADDCLGIKAWSSAEHGFERVNV
jgi:hypothetical protein